MIYLATNNGIILADRDSRWRILERGLAGQRITSVIAREGVALAGTSDGIFRSDDDGRTWREASAGLSQRHIRWLAVKPGTAATTATVAPPGLIRMIPTTSFLARRIT